MPIESKSLKRLLALEKDDTCLFHGSGLELEVLEPRQAYNLEEGENTEDGPPGVFASDRVEYAIFMALVNRVNCPNSVSSSCTFEENEMQFGACRETLSQLNEKSKGYVYVLSREEFCLRGGNEWIAFDSVVPIETIQVDRSDFRPEIIVISPFIPKPN